MARSLPLSAYLALRGSEDGTPPGDTYGTRPKGTVIWALCPDAETVRKAMLLQAALQSDGDLITVIATSPDGAEGLKAPQGRRTNKAFLTHWQPALALWFGNTIDPLVLNEIHQAGIDSFVIEVDAAITLRTDRHWIPGLTRAVLQKVTAFMAVNAAAARALEQAGAPVDAITVCGGIAATASILPHYEPDRSDLARTLHSRPVWLAAAAGLEELDTLATAHFQASRRAHRLLLIIATRVAEEGPAMAAALRDRNFEVAQRSEDEEPGDATQIYLASGTDELGLWYRLAPITYLGGTLAAGPCRTPFEPASLGSAVLSGPAVSPYEVQIAQLAAAGACRAVASDQALGEAVESLLSADHAATMAHAAWDVTTRGADVVQQIAGRIIAHLDRIGE